MQSKAYNNYNNLQIFSNLVLNLGCTPFQISDPF